MASDQTTPGFVYKVFRKEEWVTFTELGRFEGSEDDKRDGFIHLSTKEQLEDTLTKHFSGIKTVVVVAAVRTAGLPIKMEESRDHLHFPHLYGTLQLQDLISFEERKRK